MPHSYKKILLLLALSILGFLKPLITQATEINLNCTSWGCKGFIESAKIWQKTQDNTQVKLYEAGHLADNLLGFYRQVLNTQSSELDILLIDTIWPGVLGKHLVDLRQYIPEQEIKQHFQPIINNLTLNNQHLIAMPLFTDTGLLYYRKDLLEKYGFSAPETWQELEQIAKVILAGEQDPELTGFVWQGKSYEGLTCNALEWIDSFHGGTIIDEKTGAITINNPQAKQALSLIRSWIGEITPVAVLDYSELETSNHFRSGKAIFMRNWMEYWSLLNQEDSPIKGLVGLAPIPKGGPQGKHSGTLGDMSLAVSRYSQNIEQAAQLVRFLTDSQQQKRHALAYSFAPTVIDTYTDPELLAERGFMAAYKKALLYGVARPAKITGLSYPKVSKKFHHAVHHYLAGHQGLDDTLITLERDLIRIKENASW
ncbi:trehalose/maltose transport system substrate-binding protein [Allopseudospirillum japonicum]|uniref:Trehalose/maltose transport system substrate-binding protein n=1 Tax=Allopseudospirillum japonicum TaxID=64971 RepID=A0A1H6QH27_9GAMM|nr:ABC transporter substrate-binding protein [Allopseudospirillum japonicum]SEI38535.1 trehalose/maltose transport system substrate-binding protein [Allopseudospirillum japonicum]